MTFYIDLEKVRRTDENVYFFYQINRSSIARLSTYWHGYEQ
jgi:hypothetical protein